jgi:hypothetical protein
MKYFIINLSAKQLKNVFIIFILSIISIFSACKENPGFYYNSEKMADYLELTKEQREIILPKLLVIQEEVFGFFESWGKKFKGPYTTDSDEERKAFNDERETIIKKINETVNEISNLLNIAQKEKLLKIQIPELSFDEARAIMMGNMREEEKKENPIVKVFPTLTEGDIPKEIPPLSKLIDSWTVTFGMRRQTPGGFFIGTGGEGTAGTSGFPLKIEATFIDPLINIAQKMENIKSSEFSEDSVLFYFDNVQKDIIEIRLSITTTYHESYLDLNNWIIYLENDKIEQFEPLKIEKQERPLLSSSRTFPLIKRPSQQISPDKNLRRALGEPIKSAYFSLFFKNKSKDKPIITEDTQFLKLVFLKEIGKNERAEGRWVFPKEKYF